MNYLTAWLGKSSVTPADRPGVILFGSRAITTTDVDEIRKDFATVADEVRIEALDTTGRHATVVRELNEASDADLKRLVIRGMLKVGEEPDQMQLVMISLGSKLEPLLSWNTFIGLSREEEITRVVQDVRTRVTQAGHRSLSRNHWRDIASVSLFLILLALFLWFAREPTTTWAAIGVAAVALVGTYITLQGRIRRTNADPGHRIRVRHVSRAEARVHLREVRVGVITSAISIIVTLGGTYLIAKHLGYI